MKKALAAMVVLGAASYLSVGGAFAIFNGETSNPGSTIASGTLTLSDTVDSGSACFSYGPGSTGNANPGCSLFFDNSSLQVPNSAVSTTVTIANTGSVDTQDLVLYMPTCTSTTSPNAEVVGGTALCGSSSDLEMYVEETTASGTVCWYPATGCTATTPSWLGFYNFFSHANSVSSYLDLGAGPAAGQSRTFIVGFMLPSTAAGGEQGEEADFSLTWHAQTTP